MVKTIAVLMVLVICVAGQDAFAAIPKKRAVNAIIGEAEDQGSLGMLYLACALRNRKTLTGVRGEAAPRVVKKRYKSHIKKYAEIAWQRSKHSDFCQELQGANYWASSIVDKAWEAEMIAAGYRKTFTYKDHVFYKGGKVK